MNGTLSTIANANTLREYFVASEFILEFHLISYFVSSCFFATSVYFFVKLVTRFRMFLLLVSFSTGTRVTLIVA